MPPVISFGRRCWEMDWTIPQGSRWWANKKQDKEEVMVNPPPPLLLPASFTASISFHSNYCYLLPNYWALRKTQLKTSYHCLTADGSGEDALQLEDDGQRMVIGQPELQAAAKTQRLWERRSRWAAMTKNDATVRETQLLLLETQGGFSLENVPDEHHRPLLIKERNSIEMTFRKSHGVKSRQSRPSCRTASNHLVQISLFHRITANATQPRQAWLPGAKQPPVDHSSWMVEHVGILACHVVGWRWVFLGYFIPPEPSGG